MTNRASGALRKISLVTALTWIVGSTLVVSGISYTVLRHWFLQKKKSEMDPRLQIVKILQTGPEKEALNTLYLAELMQLSIDRPVTTRSFNLKMAETRLCSSPVIEKARVSLTSPNAILVDYVARRPIAWLYDYVNIGIDIHGIPFPVHPFFSPKNLPEIFLGEPVSLQWNKQIENSKMQLALTIRNILAPAPFTIKRIDVGHAFAESYGKRQITLIIEESFKIDWQSKELLCVLPRILRLSTKEYRKELGNYLVLRDDETRAFDAAVAQFEADGKTARLPEQVIDLRIAGMALIRYD